MNAIRGDLLKSQVKRWKIPTNLGKNIRNGLWWPLLKARRSQRAELADANGDDNGDAAGSEDSAGEDEDLEMEGA